MMPRRSYGTGTLYARPNKTGDRDTWYGKWRVDGRQIYRKLGDVRDRSHPAGLTRKGAEIALREAMATITAADITGPAPQRPGDRTIADVVEAYLVEQDLKQATTARDYRAIADNWLIPFFRTTAISRITQAEVEQLRDAMRGGRLRNHDAGEGEGLRPKSVRNYLVFLSSLMGFAVRKRWVDHNPCVGVKLPAVPVDVGELRFLEVYEVNDLVAAAQPGAFHVLDQALYRTAALTGLRIGELRALRWESVDFATGQIRVVRGQARGVESTPKSGRGRSVPMAPPIADALLELQATSRWTGADRRVFGHPATGEAVGYTAAMGRYRRSLKAAGLSESFRFHDLRHTFGTLLARAGEPVTSIQEWMGHSDLKTTQRYMHYAPKHDQAARIAAAFAVADPRTVPPSGSAATNLAALDTPDVTSADRRAA